MTYLIQVDHKAKTIEGYMGNLKLGLSNGTFAFGGVIQRATAGIQDLVVS